MDYRHEVWGVNGPTTWQPLLPAHGLEGLKQQGEWKREFESVWAEAGDQSAWLEFGGADWVDYEIRLGVVAEAGGNVQIPFRIQGRQGYMLDLLLGWQAVAISRFGQGVQKLSVVNHELRRFQEYQVEICIRGLSLTSYIDGRLVNQVTAGDFDKGPFALSVWNGRTRFLRPMARRLA